MPTPASSAILAIGTRSPSRLTAIVATARIRSRLAAASLLGRREARRAFVGSSDIAEVIVPRSDALVIAFGRLS